MSAEPAASMSEEEIATLMRICQKIQQKCASDSIADVPDAAISTLLSTATTVYATATHELGRTVPPFEDNRIAATWVVVTVKAMLQAVGLGSFELAMWSNRTPASDRFPS
jgi:hypothetical protein